MLNLKVGDKVVWERQVGWDIQKDITEVTEVHAKHYKVCGSGERFSLVDGWQKGYKGWCTPRIYPLTPELRDEIGKANIVRRLKNYKFEKLSLEQLREIVKIIAPSSVVEH